MRFFGLERKHAGRLGRWMLGLLCGVMALSCSPVEAHAEGKESPLDQGMRAPSSIANQLIHATSQGMRLSFSTLEIDVPSKDETHPNAITLDGSEALFRLRSLSLHGIDFSLDAPFTYNGLSRYLNVSLFSDDLYFSIDAPNDANAAYHAKYTANLTSYDEGDVDETTKGISYFEYGELDYFIYTILETMGVSSIDLDWHGQEEGSFDYQGILDALDAIEEIDSSRFRLDLPIGEETLPIGLVHNGDYVLSGIEFPIQQSGVPTLYEFENGLKVKAAATIGDGSNGDYLPPYDVDSYTRIVDSTSLFRTLASYVDSRKFGLSASFSLLHTEDAVDGDDDHFARDAVSEDAYLNLSSNLDFSKSFIDGLNVDMTFGQLGGTSSYYGVHTVETDEDTLFYLNLDEIMKVYTPAAVGSAFISSLVDALSDESIQNEGIKKLLASLLASGEGILKVIDVVKESSFMRNVENGYYESILASVRELTFLDDEIRIVIDLSQTGLQGHATVVLDGTTTSSRLASITLDHVGAVADNDTRTSCFIDGRLDILPYQPTSFDPSPYVELTHLPGWDEEIAAIAEDDQLSVTVQGYALKTGTTSVITNQAKNYNRTEQGFTFSGSLSFDLKNRLGTGNMVFTDRKEAYVNDHSLKIDVTGPEGEDDNDLNDMKGTGNQNAMYFEYDSSNVTETSKSSAYKSENRGEPENGSLKGRFSIHSLDGILQLVQDLSGTTDVRFERLTNLIGKLTAQTLLTKVIDGQYFELLASGVLESVDITPSKTTIQIKPGILQVNTGMTLILGYDGSLKPTTIEVYLTLEGDEHDTEVYAKITLGEARFSGFQFSSHNNSEFSDYSSIKTLAQFGIDTIMLGMTEDTLNSYTTYNLTGTVQLTLLALYKPKIDINVTIYLKGTHVMIFGAIHSPKVPVAIPHETCCNFFFETDGSDENGGTFYFCRHVHENYGFLNLQSRDAVDYRKVTGTNFMDHILDWICGYMLNLGDTIMNEISGGDTTAATESMHGEDIIDGLTVKNASLTAPSWKLDIDLEALSHVSILGDLTATITGIQAHYTGNDGKYYTKNALYSLTADTSILAGILKANITLTMGNINSSSGAYTDAWVGMNSYFYTKYDGSKTTGTASSIWNGSNGKTNANSNYRNASWYVAP